MSILEERLPYLDKIDLGRGSHAAPPNGLVEACVMEAVSYIAGEPWSAAPECASPVITAFLVRWNDTLPHDDRQMLKPLIPRIVGTRTTAADEETRAWMCTDWLARECAPAWLRLAGLSGRAELLERLSPLMSSESARAAQPTLAQASAAAKDAAWHAAWDAARDAAWHAARTAARDAAWDAASDAARTAARDAAWDAASAVAKAAAKAAAWDAASAAAWDAAWHAARTAAKVAARDAAWHAAWAALQPTVKGLQASALLLVDRMISPPKNAEKGARKP